MGSDLFGRGHCFIFMPYFFCRFFPAFKTSRDLASKGSWAQTVHCIKKKKDKKNFISIGSDQFGKGHCFMFFLLIFFRIFSSLKTSRDLRFIIMGRGEKDQVSGQKQSEWFPTCTDNRGL